MLNVCVCSPTFLEKVLIYVLGSRKKGHKGPEKVTFTFKFSFHLQTSSR